MDVHRLGLAALVLALAGCASQGCDQPLSGEACRTEHLLYQNDMLQAKMLIAAGQLNDYELAAALLDRAAPWDERGEVPFYQALLKIHQGPQVDEVLNLLEKAADAQQPYAVALLYKIHAQPYLIDDADPLLAESYRARYAELDVAKSGYPSFQKASEVVDELVNAPKQLNAAAPAGQHNPQ